MSQDFIHLCWNPNPPRQRMADIIARVAEKHGVSISDIKGPSRLRMYAHPRQEAMSEMVDTGLWSTPNIGRVLGGRDHSTVIYGARAHKRRAGIL